MIKCQCCPPIETSQLIYTANQLTGFYMRATLALNGLTFNLTFKFNVNPGPSQKSEIKLFAKNL